MVCLKQTNKTHPLRLLPAEIGTESKCFGDCHPYCTKLSLGIIFGLGFFWCFVYFGGERLGWFWIFLNEMQDHQDHQSYTELYDDQQLY